MTVVLNITLLNEQRSNLISSHAGLTLLQQFTFAIFVYCSKATSSRRYFSYFIVFIAVLQDSDFPLF